MHERQLFSPAEVKKPYKILSSRLKTGLHVLHTKPDGEVVEYPKPESKTRGNVTVMLGAKTTCKDRWRQVLNEANRVDKKYLFTLQQGISRNQLREMNDAQLTLVVPHQYISDFPSEYRSSLLDLHGFIRFVAEKQEHLPRLFAV